MKRVCPCCSATVQPVQPSPLWKLALLLGYLVIASAVIGCSLMGLGILGLLPVLVCAGLGLLPPLHDLAFRDALCPRCGKVIDERARLPLGA